MNLAELTIQQLNDLSAAIAAEIQNRTNANKTMCNTIRIEAVGSEKIRVFSYFNEEFVTAARNLRGAWESGAWVFNASQKENVKRKLVEIFGVDGTSPYEVCTLEVNDLDLHCYHGGVGVFNRPIARAFGRDTGAKLADDIYVIEGKARSGGSVKNWSTNFQGSVEIANFPVSALDRDDVKEAIEAGWATVKAS